MEADMREAFYRDPYSFHCNALRYMGQWNLDTDSSVKKRLHFLYRVLVFAFETNVVVCGMIDLHQSRTDLKKVVFNLCTTMLITGIWVKNLHILLHVDRVNNLRQNLFKDGWKQKSEEDSELKEIFAKILRTYRKTFYYAAYVLLPLWLFSSLATLVRGPRALPFPIWTPGDLDNDLHFAVAFIYHSLGASFVIFIVMHADLAMFSIVLQIAAQYRILAKNISKINEMYMGGGSPGGERGEPDKNKSLVAHKTKQILRECIRRQLELLAYVRELEYCYNKPMLIQLITGFILSIGNGLELIVVSMNFSMKLSYQLGYSIIVVSDVFMCCTLADLLVNERRQVVVSLYDLAWYDMDNDIQKDLKLITMGAQKIMPLTAGKLFRLNLTMFLEMMKNIYSWLALFRQVVIKK